MTTYRYNAHVLTRIASNRETWHSSIRRPNLPNDWVLAAHRILADIRDEYTARRNRIALSVELATRFCECNNLRFEINSDEVRAWLAFQRLAASSNTHAAPAVRNQTGAVVCPDRDDAHQRDAVN